jgi:DNA-binding MarR family transcriptional regulator
MRKAYTSPDVETIRVSLVELRRLFQRKELTELWAAAAGHRSRLDYADLLLLDAIRVAQDRASGATVGAIARLLGVDPSRASRQVARAVRTGLLRRRAAQGDGRVVVLEVTPAGAALQARGSQLTRTRIELALAGWSAADRAQLARLFARFAGAITAERGDRTDT